MVDIHARRVDLTRRLIGLERIVESCDLDDEIELVTAIDCHNAMAGIRKKLKALDRKFESEDITDADIENARAYPIHLLIDFNHGRATAFCHDDRSPSLHHWKKGNKARCFVCDKTYNPIDVLMERDKMSFPEAVRSLLCR